jgi:hypothetical protein
MVSWLLPVLGGNSKIDIAEAPVIVHVTDDWLRLSTAAVPLIAAAVTGTFLFVNRSGGASSGSGLWLKFIRVCLRTNPNHALQRDSLAAVGGRAYGCRRGFSWRNCTVLDGRAVPVALRGRRLPKSLGNSPRFGRRDTLDLRRSDRRRPIPPYAAYRRHRRKATLPYRHAIKKLDSMDGRERAPVEWCGGADSNQLERNVIAATIEAFDATRNGRTTADPAESSAKQGTNDRVADSTERE